MASRQQSEHTISCEVDQRSPQLIRAELARVLESTAFKTTPQRRAMLEFVVEEELAGRGQEIKGYNIGVKVFGRAESFDPNSDPVVRLEARRLRHDLDSYYVSEGRSDPLRITIPTGRYVPEFVCQEVETDTDEGIEMAAASGSGDDHTVLVHWKHWMAGGVLATLAVAALASWTVFQRQNDNEVALRTPAVAVVGFDVTNQNEKDEFLAAGMASRIVSDLSRFPDIRIYSPQNGSSQSPTDPMELGRRMGVSYVLMGELQSGPSAIHVGARLIDTRSGQIMWTSQFDRNLGTKDLTAIQSELAAGIASSLGQPYGVIRTAMTRNIPDHSLPSLTSYECVLRAYNFRRTYTPALYQPVLSCLEKAVRSDPGYAEAWSMLGFTHLVSVVLSILPSDPARTFDTAEAAALRSIELDRNNVLGLKVLSVIQHYKGNYGEAERYARLALKINPNDPDTLYQLGWRLAIRGRFDEGVPLLRRAIERTVNPPGTYYHMLAVDSLMKGDGEGMLALAKHASVDGSALSQSLIAMAHGLLGNREAGERAIERMYEITPGYNPIDRWRNHQATDEIIEVMNAALHKSGWPTMHKTAKHD